MDRKAMTLMMLKRVCFAGEVCSGKGSVARLASLYGDHAVVFHGQSAANHGWVDRVSRELQKGGIRATAVPMPSGEPTFETIKAAQQRLEEAQPDWIVAVGGGSVLDAAKLAWALYEAPTFELSGRAPVPALGNRAKLVAIPTTAGSGSEASQAAVVIDSATHKKVPLLSTEWLPHIAILDPEFTLSLPAEITACTAFDALAHSVEAAVSPLSHAMVRALAGSAIRMIFRALPVAVAQPSNVEAREDLLIASHLGGLAQSFASTGFAHALSHSASGCFGVAHAHATAFFLPPTVTLSCSKAPAPYRRLAQEAGFENEEALRAGLSTLAASVGIPQSLGALIGRDPVEADLNALSAAAAQDACLKTNSARLSAADISTFVASL